MRFLPCYLLLLICCPQGAKTEAAEAPAYLLAAELNEGDTSVVSVELEVGGDLLISEKNGIQKLPLTVTGELRYTEQILAWSTDAAQPARSLRHYQTAKAKIQVDKEGLQRELPTTSRMVLAGIHEAQTSLNGASSPLTRKQFDLVNVVGNTLALNRLLPGRTLKEGDSWDHDAAAIATLLGMDHVAVCEMRSVVTGDKNQQVQIRMAGTVHGTIDGAPTEIQLRGAYLFHQRTKRITKLNLAIQEKRTASLIVPGLDVVAKISISVKPAKATEAMLAELSDRTNKVSEPLAKTLLYDAPQQGYRFLHDRGWYVTAEQSDLVALRCLQNGNSTAHCNVTTLPARSEGRATSLEQFERDVRESLSDNLETVIASTQWKTAEGHDCLGVVAHGKVKEVPIEWRYYLISSPGLPRVSLAVTVEQAQLEHFGDADREIVESLQLLLQNETASKPSKQLAR